jgi:hypothetical protein
MVTPSSPRRWKQQGPQAFWYPTPLLGGVVTHKTMTQIFIAEKISSLALFNVVKCAYVISCSCTVIHSFSFHNNHLSESEEEDPRHGSGKLQSQKQHELNLDGEIAGLRKKRPVLNSALMNKGMGSWEKHTRGIGAKLLLQVVSTELHLYLFQ